MDKELMSKAARTTITRDVVDLDNVTGNLYKSVVVLSKRANQIATQTKEELHAKLKEFETVTDSLEEIYENREQIEISKHYERQAKPTAVAIEELLDDRLFVQDRKVEPEMNGSEESGK
jgi:DNA-directed RNA polymerase subunit K/omega